MALSTQPYKGARDFYPEDMRKQKYMFGKMRKAVEEYGYLEYGASLLEPEDLYKAKSGDEIVNEQTYVFDDRGGRRVVIRPEMTPSVSRMVAARRQELAYPVRWYSIPNLWRYERPQRGRLREHWQLNVDIFGVEGVAAEQEIIMVADAIFQEFGAKRSQYLIKLNSRKFLNYVLSDYLGLDAVQVTSVFRLIDRMAKIERADFIAQADAICRPDQREAGVVEKLLTILDAKGFDGLPEAVRTNPALNSLRMLLEMLHEAGVANAVFDVTIMRGLDYYTDIVFEINDTNPENNRAMLGGGRYDGLVGLFGVEPVPTVGFGFGDVTLANFLETNGLMPALPPETDAYVVLAGDVLQASQRVLAEIRTQGVKLAVDITGRKLDKQLSTAVKQGVRYALIIGEQELADNRFTLRDLKTGTEERHSPERIVSLLQDYRRPTGLLADES